MEKNGRKEQKESALSCRLNNASASEANNNFYYTIIVAHLAVLFSGCDRLAVLNFFFILFPFFRSSNDPDSLS